jgi:nucleotide-binding universal stress UspA family protein
MSYAALMVHYDGQGLAHQRVQLAARLVTRFDATLVGIAGYAYPPTFLADGHREKVGKGGSVREEVMRLRAGFEAKFRGLAKCAKDIDWRGSVASVNDLVTREARAANLVTVGPPAAAADLFYSLDQAVIILRARRPVLMVPDRITSFEARCVVIAWKDCRAARRAVCDALPLLKGAEKIIVLSVCEQSTEIETQRSIDNLASYLSRHDCEVKESACLNTGQSIARQLLRIAHHEKADLIAAGGYGRSRLGEWALGGVTRELLTGSSACCLFSH